MWRPAEWSSTSSDNFAGCIITLLEARYLPASGERGFVIEEADPAGETIEEDTGWWWWW